MCLWVLLLFYVVDYVVFVVARVLINAYVYFPGCVLLSLLSCCSRPLMIVLFSSVCFACVVELSCLFVHSVDWFCFVCNWCWLMICLTLLLGL